jgi:hypothetical protein
MVCIGAGAVGVGEVEPVLQHGIVATFGGDQKKLLIAIFIFLSTMCEPSLCEVSLGADTVKVDRYA